ncbi:MAG: glycosyltransferase [Cetobacterium sp.]
MKNLVIRSGSLRMGGLERVLIEVIQNINLKKYKLSLIIEDDSAEDNVFLESIPENIDLYFLKPNSLIKKTHYFRENKHTIYNKIMYNFYMNKEHRYVFKKTKETLKRIEIKNGEIDVFLDYDWGARRYIDKLKVKKKIVWVHNSVSNLLKKKSKIDRLGKNLKKYDVVVGICNEMKDELEKIYPFLKNKVVKIYNPFNFERIRKASIQNEELTIEEKLLLNDEYIIAVSRLDTNQKDYETLFKGYKKYLENSTIKEKLYIVGDGPSKSEIKKMISDLKLEDNIILLGMKKNPYIWIKNSKLFVHSSKYEGFGLVLVEALSLGKVVISSNCEVGPKEILQNGKYGKLFNVGNFNELSDCLFQILSNSLNKEKYEKLSEKRAEDFNVKKVIKEYEELIDNI